jgi:hypothetical protein
MGSVSIDVKNPLADEFRKALAPALGSSRLPRKVLAVDVIVRAEPLAECVEEVLIGRRRLGAEERDCTTD